MHKTRRSLITAATLALTGCVHSHVLTQPIQVAFSVTPAAAVCQLAPVHAAAVTGATDPADPTGGHKIFVVDRLFIGSAYTVSCAADGYVPFSQQLTPFPPANAELPLRVTLALVRPQPTARAPLGPFDRDATDPDTGAPLPVATALPANQIIPPIPNIRWWRGNAWSVTIPGAPYVQDGSSTHPERLLTWFLDRYSLDWQQRWLDEYARRGYTHWALSWPDSRDRGGEDGNGQTIAQFVATAQRVKAAGFYVHVFWGSKDFDPMNDTADGWPTRTDAAFQALAAAHAIDTQSPCWECDLWNVPGDQLEGIIDHFAAEANAVGVLTYIHFSVEHISWQTDGTDSFSWWRLQKGKLTGLLYQANVTWSAGMLQARLNDGLVRLNQDSGFGHQFDDVAWELKGFASFDGDHPTEDESDLTGWEAICAIGPIPVMGFGNGARQPSGAVIQ